MFLEFDAKENIIYTIIHFFVWTIFCIWAKNVKKNKNKKYKLHIVHINIPS